jgi:hypothetical protein
MLRSTLNSWKKYAVDRHSLLCQAIINKFVAEPVAVDRENYRVFYWDTFDNETIKIGEADLLGDAIAIVQEKYGDRIHPQGADQVDIVNWNGEVVGKYKIR